MEMLKGNSILIGIVSAAEHEQIPSEIATKIDAILNEKFDDLLTNKALMETARHNAEQSLDEYKEKFLALQSTHESLTEELHTVTDLQTQLGTNLSELATVRTQCTDLEVEAAKMRHERHLAVDERDAATAMVARKDGEVARLQQDMKVMQDQLQREIEVRCEAQTQLGDLESKLLQLEYREKRVEQERTLFNTQVAALEEQLTARTNELMAMRRDTSSRCVILETHLTTLQDEHRVLQQHHTAIQEQHDELLQRYTQTQKEHCDDKHNAQQRLDAFQLEMDAQRKLADLYRIDAEAKGKHVEELERALEEAKVRLDEAIERYGDLETSTKAERLASDELITKKAECIALLRKELQTANDLLSQPKSTHMNEDLAQTSNLSGHGTGMSLSQIYNQYVRASEQVGEEREEAERLRGYIRKIMEELQEKGPLLARQRDDLERAVSTVEQLTHAHDEMQREVEQMRKQQRACECEQLRVQLGDMGRQVCRLLQQRDLLTTDDDAGNVISSQDIISKRLVTFSSISELQQNNQRLLAVVRELSAKQEEREGTDQLDNIQEQLDRLNEAHTDLLEEQKRQHKRMKLLTGQRDTYKALYQQNMKSDHPINQNERPYDLNDANSSSMDGEGDDTPPHHSPTQQPDTVQQLKDKIQQLESDLSTAQKRTQKLTSDNETYRTEKSANEKVLIELNERLRQEAQQLSSGNSALTTTLDTTQLHLQTAKRNSDVLRRQVDGLEEKLKIHAQAQVKLETSLMHYKDEVHESGMKFSKNEVALRLAQKEVALLSDANERLLKERETFRQECQSLKVLHTNIALIKATLERTDVESRMRMEESLCEQQRECAALRRRLQEEQDHFRTLADNLQAKQQSANQLMESERAIAERLRTELAQVRIDLQTKTQHIDTLQSTQTGQGTNMIDGGKYRDIEQQLHSRQCELDAYVQKLDVTKHALDQHSNVAEEASKQLTVLSEQYNIYRVDTEQIMNEQRVKIAELQEKCADLDTELSLQRTDHLDEQSQLTRLQQRLNAALEHTAALETAATAQNSELDETRRVADEMSDKYSREVALHTEDLRMLNALKITLDNVKTELQQLQCKHTNLLDEQVQKEVGWKNRDEIMQKERVQLQQRFDDLIAQNTLLHDQIQQMNANLSVLQVQDPSAGSSNVSFNEDNVQGASDSQLMKIIKYLRQEKDYALSKAEIIESELTRMRLELEMAQKQLVEARQGLEDERHKSETTLVGNAKYAEVLRKVETMNAITDSNRTLRGERDQLLHQVTELRGEMTKLEGEHAPLQEQLSALQRHCDALQSENATLRGEATRWRQRANSLIEKTNRTSPEDWKKLQTERETLAKQLTIERANIVRLNDDLTNANRERGKLEETLKSLRSTSAQLKDVTDELTTVKNDLQHLKSEHSQLNADHITLGKDLTNKDSQLTDLRSQLAQVRKIAKKYKVQYEELQTTTQESADEAAQRIVRLEEEMRAQQEATTATQAQLTARCEASILEVERTTQMMQMSKERFAVLIKNAKDRIVELAQQKNKAESEVDRVNRILSGSKEQGGTVAVAVAGASGDSTGNASSATDGIPTATPSTDELTARLSLVEQENTIERERHRGEVDELKERLAQLQRLLEESAANVAANTGNTGQATDSRTVGVATEQPTVAVAPHRPTNMKPMMSVAHPHVASIRPQRATVTTTPSTLAVPPQQVQVHTTAPSSGTTVVDNSSPTSSHDQQQQQQLPTIRVLPLVSDASGSSSSSTAAAASTSSSSSTATVVGVVSATTSNAATSQQQQQQASASTSQPAPTPTVTAGSSTSSGSSTVTTSGVKRMRSTEDLQTDTATAGTSGAAAAASAVAAGKVQAQVQPQVKRSRLIARATRPRQEVQVQSQQQGLEEQQQLVEASDEGTAAAAADATSEQAEADDAGTATLTGDVEYQVPTSSQRDHDDDVEPEDMDDDAEEDMQVIDLVESDEGDDEEDEDDEAEAAATAEEVEEEEEDEEEDMDEEEDDDDEETREGEDEEPQQAMEDDEDQAEDDGGEDDEGGAGQGQQMEAISSSATATSSSVGRQQHQQQQLLLPEECADDSIVPSTPTLFLPRRGASGDGVSSPHPHVPTVAPGRLFTFTTAEQQAASGSNDANSDGGEQEVQEVRDTGTAAADTGSGAGDGDEEQLSSGRSVPSTPTTLSHHTIQSPGGESSGGVADGGDGEGSGSQLQQVEGSEEAIVGEMSAGAGTEDEGREAEATPATVASTQQGAGIQRRSARPVSSSSSSPATIGQTGQVGSRQVTPIVWDNQQQGQQHRSSPRHPEMLRGRGLPVQRARRSRGGMLPRGAHGYSRY